MRLLEFQDVPPKLIDVASHVARITKMQIEGFLEDAPLYGVHMSLVSEESSDQMCAIVVFKYDVGTDTYVGVPTWERPTGLAASYTRVFHEEGI